MGEILTLPAAGARRIPTYNADGERIRDYAEATIRDLVSFGRMVVLENRKGKILFAQFVRREPPAWRPASRAKHKLIVRETQLPGLEACAAIFAVPLDLAQADLAMYQRAIFQQVLLSVKHIEVPPREKVVSIDSYRHNARRLAKPETRAA